MADEVKCKLNDTAGVVIANYVINNVTYLDVRDTAEHIHYKTPASNWEVVRTREEIE
jgi:hypothetical protein